MSVNPKSNARMQQKSVKELLTIVESGSLNHAAARYELGQLGLKDDITLIDMKFRTEGRSSHV